MARVIIDEYGDKRYFNDADERHREDGPALISPDGRKVWYRNGVSSSTTHPGMLTSSGKYTWYVDGNRNNPDRPSEESPNGLKRWFIERDLAWPRLK